MASTDKHTPPRSCCATPHLIATRYLLSYNICMTAGWTIVLFRLLQAAYLRDNVYNAVHWPLKVFQTGAILEIIHSATGLIRAPTAPTALQVASRVTLVWGVADPVNLVRSKISFFTMVLAWSLTEIPRYFYFSVSALTSNVPYWVVFTRYSTFIPLYPLGASSEWFTMFAALPFIRKARLFSISLPNRFNFAFDYFTACVAILVLYIPGLPFMYSHMLRQRRKYVLNPAAKLAKAE